MQKRRVLVRGCWTDLARVEIVSVLRPTYLRTPHPPLRGDPLSKKWGRSAAPGRRRFVIETRVEIVPDFESIPKFGRSSFGTVGLGRNRPWADLSQPRVIEQLPMACATISWLIGHRRASIGIRWQIRLLGVHMGVRWY